MFVQQRSKKPYSEIRRQGCGGGALSFKLKVRGRQRLLSLVLQWVPGWGISDILPPASGVNYLESL